MGGGLCDMNESTLRGNRIFLYTTCRQIWILILFDVTCQFPLSHEESLSSYSPLSLCFGYLSFYVNAVSLLYLVNIFL